VVADPCKNNVSGYAASCPTLWRQDEVELSVGRKGRRERLLAGDCWGVSDSATDWAKTPSFLQTAPGDRCAWTVLTFAGEDGWRRYMEKICPSRWSQPTG
jgi:hypothetical protein